MTGGAIWRSMRARWTRPPWPVAFDLIAYGLVLLAILLAASLWTVLGP